LKGRNRWRVKVIVTLIALISVGLPLWGGITQSWSPVSDYFTVQSYHQGQCTILSKQLIESSYISQDTGDNVYQYVPDFTFLVQDASRKSYQAEGYGIDQNQAQQQDAQAILDSYQISGSYSCWYDPANPSHAVLTREVAYWDSLPLGFFLLLVALCLGLFWYWLLPAIWRKQVSS
jgi:Protein of unknown function (DUF3592)